MLGIIVAIGLLKSNGHLSAFPGFDFSGIYLFDLL
jgi:hypothetical protein